MTIKYKLLINYKDHGHADYKEGEVIEVDLIDDSTPTQESSK